MEELALHNLGGTDYKLGNYDSARRFLEQALSLNQETGSRWLLASQLITLGKVAEAQEDYAQAMSHFVAAKTIDREQRIVGDAAIDLARVTLLQGDTATAREIL